MYMNKGQSSVEFMMIFAVLLIVLGLAVWISGTKSTELNTIKTNLEINEVLNKISSKINTVHIEGNGFSTEMILPATIRNRIYNITIIDNRVILNLEGLTFLQSVLTENITGSFKIGINYLKNNNGVVEIS